MPDATYQPLIRHESQGDKIGVASGGVIDFETGAALKIAGTDRTAPLSTAPAAVAAGYKVARGETALDGANPTPVATGLATVIAFAATLKGTAAPGTSTSTLTADISGATVNVYAWKPTATADTALVASSGTESFYWVAVGT